jgi:hypothetical protein
LRYIHTHWQGCFRGIHYIYICYLNLNKVTHHIVFFRFSKRHLVEQFFYTLLNVESCEKLPDMSELRHLVEAEILSNKHFPDLTHVRNILGGKWKNLVNWTLMIGWTPQHLRGLNCGHFGFSQTLILSMYSLSVILLWTIPYILTYHYPWNTESLIVVVAFTSNLLLSGILKKNQYQVVYCASRNLFLFQDGFECIMN